MEAPRSREYKLHCHGCHYNRTGHRISIEMAALRHNRTKNHRVIVLNPDGTERWDFKPVETVEMPPDQTPF